MTKDENLLITLSEECAEVQQAISKALRFGMNSHNPSTPKISNETDIMIEYYQLVAVMEMLTESGVLHRLNESDASIIKENKRFNVSRYQDMSYGRGCIKE